MAANSCRSRLGSQTVVVVKLQLVETSIEVRFLEKFLMATCAHDPPLIHHYDAIRIKNRREPVSDSHDGTPLGEALQSGLHHSLALGIQSRCRLIQKKNRGIFEKRPGNRQSLLLPTAELTGVVGGAVGCLIGGRTLRLHGSTCLIHAADLLEQRRHQGRTAQPDALVVSRTGRFDPQLRFFRQPLQRRLLLASPQPAAVPAGFMAVHPLEGWFDALADLAGAGLRRLVLLGGAELAGALLVAARVDQLPLTLCPQLLGGPHSWLPEGVTLAANRWQLLEQRPLEGEELMLRYGRLSA